MVGPGKAGNLLIVDDNEALGRMLGWEFEDLGYRVWRAANCEQAVAAARSGPFDFALIDFHLPDGDGRRLSRWLRRISPRLRVVMMSCDRERATAGAPSSFRMAFVEKPVPTARIHHLFGGRGRSRQPVSGQYQGS